MRAAARDGALGDRCASEWRRAAIGLSVEVRLVPPQTIARSEGKAVRVVHSAGDGGVVGWHA